MSTILISLKKLFFSEPTESKPEANLTGLIVAVKVKSINPHPNADRLVLVSVDSGKEVIEPIVCGAKNFAVGDMVILALPGATIPKNIHSKEHESFILEKATIRGVESQGMLCAEFELGQSETLGEGIKILPEQTKPGTILF